MSPAGETVSSAAFAGLTADLEILRGDFARALYGAVLDRCEYRFGTCVTSLTKHASGVLVTFNHGDVQDFELVICAEGMSSSTHLMVRAAETRFRCLGASMAF